MQNGYTDDQHHFHSAAANPEMDDDGLPIVTPVTTAFQQFRRDRSATIRQNLLSSGLPADVGSLGTAIGKAWGDLEISSRSRYEQVAAVDKERFIRESHQRDIAATERAERKRRSRTEIIEIAGGVGRSTREMRKKEARREERRRRKRAEHCDGSSSDDSSSEQSESSSSSSDLASESSSAESSVEENGRKKNGKKNIKEKVKKKHKKEKTKKVQRPPTTAVLERRKEKIEREEYIESRQEKLRSERAAQAKKRLDFLVKQSDIFRHFGKVKEDRGNYYGRKTVVGGVAGDVDDGSNSATTDTASTKSRRDMSSSNTNETEELEQADESAATFLTTQPTTISHGKMRSYQVEGLNWMIRLQENGVNGILADEMGLGKTLQSISVLVYMLEYQNINGPHLIVVPKSTLSNWMNELKRWSPTLRPLKFHGNKEERESIVKNALKPGQKDEERTWHVCVTTYEVCSLNRNDLNKFAWSYLIIDEAHRLKNEASAFSCTVRAFETRYRLLLTGTPLQNNLHELWALLNFLVPDVFANAEQFDDWFNLDIDDAEEKNKLISQLHKILRPFMLRRLKADVEKSLPPKHETILFTGMSAMQKRLYKDILMRDIDLISSGNDGRSGGSGSRTAVLNIVMQLRKCAGHPYLFPGVEDRSLPPLGEHLVSNCGKMVLLDKLLVRLKETGHRVLLFTQMTRILDILEDYLVMRGFAYCRIDGSTDYEKRESNIDDFNKPSSDKFIFLLSTRAGGLGINLQTADVVILYDSDWNPQADLQAQDRAHRIGQKKPVQVFRLVTEHTVEEKVVERAQQKLKLDAMVVQQGRLRGKDNLLREDLLEAVRFGADKVFKSKDSSITDDDIDLILASGREKTRELNEKLLDADKGDMLDFKLDGGSGSVQTFEGVDYSSKEGREEIKAARAQAEILGILDRGKRVERITNYNENQLYRQQMNITIGNNDLNRKRKRDTRLPKSLRLPKLEEWQMFDRESLEKLQEQEENAFRALPEEMQKMARGKSVVLSSSSLSPYPLGSNDETGDDREGDSSLKSGVDCINDSNEGSRTLTIADLPPLLSVEQQAEKDLLLTGGFVDWDRGHYNTFVKASSKYRRNNYSKIAVDVGKPESSIKDYALAFWDDSIGKKLFSDTVYERAVKAIESGEKKLQEIKALEKGTKTLISLFDNPWRELEFTYVNCKDKIFTLEEDRHLLCWAYKYGYGQWAAIKMAIRRSPNFRFDFYLRTLPTEALGKRCEHLMKFAEKEVDCMERQAREDAACVGDSVNSFESPVKLPRFKELKAMRRKREIKEFENEKKRLQGAVDGIEEQMDDFQKRLKFLDKYAKEIEGNNRGCAQSSEFPDDHLANLADLVVRSGYAKPISIANDFCSEYGQITTKKMICSKIDDISKKRKTRRRWGDKSNLAFTSRIY